MMTMLSMLTTMCWLVMAIRSAEMKLPLLLPLLLTVTVTVPIPITHPITINYC